MVQFSAKINIIEKKNLIEVLQFFFISLLVLLLIGFLIITKIISKNAHGNHFMTH
jgi:hypothetical protein